MKNKPIGVFDSGIGGLTVLKEIIKALPREDTIYFGDTARVPYGTKSSETVTRYSVEVSRFLLSRGVKLLVVACNTASAYALEELKKISDVPVVGVIEPAARKAVSSTVNKRIGIIGTEGTIRSNSYVDAITKISGGLPSQVLSGGELKITKHGEKRFGRYFEIKTNDVTIFTKACPLFVPLAEEGWTDNEVSRMTARIYLKGLEEENIDVLLLGCTHYPLLKKTIQDEIGEDVTLIDSGRATALTVHGTLKERGLLRENSEKAVRRFFVTDSPERFTMVGERFLSALPIKAELVRIGS